MKFAALAFLIALAAKAVGSPFTDGNVAVVRVTDENGALTNVTARVFVDEYTTSGILVQTIALPASGPNAFTSFGAAVAEGALSRTPNGKWLCLGGYNTAIGYTNATISLASQVPRVVGIVDGLGNFAIAATNATFFNTNNIRGACSDGTNNFWGNGNVSGTGAGGISYYGFGTSAVVITNITSRVSKIINGSIYFSASLGAGSIFKFGGTPKTTSAATVFLNTGLSASPYGFSINGAGNLAYVADDRTTGGGGIQKWTNSNGSWSLAYTLSIGTTNEGARGLAVDWSQANPVLYASSSTTSFFSVANRLVRIVDTGAASAAQVLVVAATNSSFRGVEFGPDAIPELIAQPQSVTLPVGTNATFTVSAIGSGPLSYQWHKDGLAILGEVLPVLQLTNIQVSSAGNYSVTVSNRVGSVTTSNATLTIQRVPIAGLFNSGTDNTHAVLPYGQIDPHIFIVDRTDHIAGSSAYVILDPAGSWLPNDSISRWISARPRGADAVNSSWTYRVQFNLSGYDVASVRLKIRVASDNSIDWTRLNGNDIGFATPFEGFHDWNNLVLTNGFVSGMNSLDFRLEDFGYISGFRIEISGTAIPTTGTGLFLDDGLVAYYPLNGNAADVTGHGNDGILHGPLGAVDRFGNANRCLSFDGAGQYVSAPADNLPTGPRTVSLWFKANRVDKRPPLLGYGGDTCGNSFFMALNHWGNSSWNVTSHCDAYTLAVPFTSSPINDWHHWAVVTDFNGMSFYVNGRFIGSRTGTTQTYVAGKQLGMGTIPSPTGYTPYTDSAVNYLDGYLDEVRIYNRPLSASEIQALHAGPSYVAKLMMIQQEDGFRLKLSNSPGYFYMIQSSSNLVDWIDTGYILPADGSMQFVPAIGPKTFYRAVLQ